MTKRAKPGDVLEVKVDDGVVLLQYLGRHPLYGDAVMVSPVRHGKRPVDATGVFDDGYVTFYPASLAVNQGLVEVIGNFPSPGVPKRFRLPGAVSGRKVNTWVIEDESGKVVRERLSDDERHLPIAAVWNHALLVERVKRGWRPELEA